MQKNYLLLLLLLAYFGSSAQKVGLGTTSPQYPLDIAGSLRLQQGPQQQPIIFFDGSGYPFRSSFGMIDNNLIGFFTGGSNTTNNVVMNIGTGRVGINTLTPTASLDVNGDIRLRSGSPASGAAFTSVDASGNAQWKKPVAFKVSGASEDPGSTTLPINQWVKVGFTTVVDYNVGLAWGPVSQVFTAPAKGIYHFDFTERVILTKGITWRIMRKRNGVDTEVYYANSSATINGATTEYELVAEACTDLQLESSDQIWVEIKASIKISYAQGGKNVHFFSGHLVSLL